RWPPRATRASSSPRPTTPTSGPGGRLGTCWDGTTPSPRRQPTSCGRSPSASRSTRPSPTAWPSSGCSPRSRRVTGGTAYGSTPATPRPETDEHTGGAMGRRKYTLFTGQWADLPLEEVARLAASWGYDGLEIAVSGEHLDAWRWDDDDYVEERLGILRKHGLG